MAELDKREHPMQPVCVADDGAIRFKANDIVRYLLDAGGLDLNTPVGLPFAAADWDQLYQLIGYSVSGYCDLPNVSDDSKDAAYEKVRQTMKVAP